MSLSVDVTVRKYLRKYPSKTLGEVIKNRDCNVDQLARFWIQTFGFFYDSVLQHRNLAPLKEKIKKHQAIALDVYKDCKAGNFTKRFQQITEQASYYAGDDAVQLRQSQLYYLSYLPFPLGQFEACQLRGTSDQVIVESMRNELEQMISLMEQWVEGKKRFEDLPEDEQIQLEKILFSKAALIWEGACYNWYSVAQLWVSLERETVRFLEKLPCQYLIAQDSMPSLMDIMKKVVQDEGAQLSSLSFREFVAYLSAKSIGCIWNIHFSPEMSKELARKEEIRQQSLLYAKNIIEKPSSHFFKCVDVFIKIRALMFAGQETKNDYDKILDWIYFSPEKNFSIQGDDSTPESLKYAFQIVKSWREAYLIQSKSCFIFFKLIAEDRRWKNFNVSTSSLKGEDLVEKASSYKTIEEILRELNYGFCDSQIDKLHSILLFSFSEKLGIASILYTSSLGNEWKSYLGCYVEGILFLHDYQVPSPFLKRLLINWLKSEVPPDTLDQQLALLRLIQKLSGTRLSSTAAYVWLASCPNSRKMEGLLQEFERYCCEIVPLASSPDLSPQLLSSFQESLAHIVELSSDRSDWKMVKKQLLVEIGSIDASFPSEWEELISNGMESAYPWMLAETMTLLTYSTLPIGGHLFFSDFICKEAIMDQEVKVGEEDSYFLRSHTLYPYLQSFPQWRGIYRSWDLPSNEQDYPIFNLVLVDLRTFQTITIREPVEVAWEILHACPDLLDALHLVAIRAGEDINKELPTHKQAKLEDPIQIPTIEGVDVRKSFYSFIEKLKVQFRLGLLKLNPYFAQYLPPASSGPNFLEKKLEENALIQGYDEMIEEVNADLKKEIDGVLKNFDASKACEGCTEKKIISQVPLVENCFTGLPCKEPLSYSYSLIFEVDTTQRCINPDSILREIVFRCGDQTQMVRYPEALCKGDFKQIMQWQLRVLMQKNKDFTGDRLNRSLV